MNAASSDRRPAIPDADLEVMRRTLAEPNADADAIDALLCTTDPSRTQDCGRSHGDVALVRRLFREHRIDLDLRLRGWASIVRRRKPWLSFQAAWYRQAERRVAACFPKVHAAQTAARADGGLKNRSQFARLWEIACLLEILQPKSCLEFGTGASTAMLAACMLGRGSLLSVEESPYWHARVQQYLHQFASGAVSLQADKVLTEFDGEPVVHYDLPHDREYDLVYVDGPANEPPETLTPVQREAAFRLDPRGRLANVDLELMWNAGIFPRFIILDGRLSTLRRWYRKGIDRYDLRLKSEYAAQAAGKPPNYMLHHTVLIRRDAGVGRSNGEAQRP